MPKKTSPEKVALIKALGGQIAFTPNNVNIDSEDSIFGRTQKILQENQEAVTIDQVLLITITIKLLKSKFLR